MATGTILDAVGDTPLVRLPRLSADHPGDILLKLESLNPGGSHKVRIAKAMIEAYEREGVLVRGSGMTIMEATGGNTGMGIAMAGAAYGYDVVLVVPDNYSAQKCRRLECMGARVELADSGTGPNPHGRRAEALLTENHDWVMLGQAVNQANPDAHRRTTAREILGVVDPARVRFLVAGIGTGGHITGVGEVLKAENDEVEVIGVQPEGCDLLEEKFVDHKLQGLSVGILPPVLNRAVIDEMASVGEEEAIAEARKLMRLEGISAGLSSGANIAVARRLLPRCEAGEYVLTFAYDCADDYPELLSAPPRSSGPAPG
jgi:cysteine synthase